MFVGVFKIWGSVGNLICFNEPVKPYTTDLGLWTCIV